MRDARFEGGMRFIERVTTWTAGREIRFTIELQDSGVSSGAMRDIRGEAFHILDAGYWIEPLGTRQTRLHLRSHHALRSHLAPYGALWTRAIMAGLQGYVVAAIKRRSETEGLRRGDQPLEDWCTRAAP